MTEASAPQFTEDIALWFEQSGVPRMAGRVLGWLLVCDPPHQSADQIAEALGASRGSISTVTRLLANSTLVERVAIPGDRKIYHRAIADWSGMIEVQQRRIVALREILERGIAALDDEPEDRAERLRQVHTFATFWEDELARVLERANAERAARR